MTRKFAAMLAVLALAGCAAAQQAPPAAAPVAPASAAPAPASASAVLGAPDDPGSWPRPGRDLGDAYYSPLDGINPGNVARLGLAFEFTDFMIRGGRSHYALESTPVMDGGRLFFSGPWGEVYAVDARSGETVWHTDTRADGQYARNACCG